MPDKQNENKLKAMLERRGYIRKTASLEEPAQEEPVSARTRPEDDLRYLFGTLGSETPNVTPAARQPVPGMQVPVIPAEPSQATQRTEQRLTERVVPINQPPVERTQPTDIAPPEQPHPTERKQPPLPEREQPRVHEAPKPAPAFASATPIEDELDEEEAPAPAPAHAAMPSFNRPAQQPQAESYTDKYLSVDELYEVLALKSKRTDTIYLVEEYLKTLPTSLPDESRREIVGKIVAASGFDYDLLMGDGVLRVKMLKDYAERFARHTDDYVSNRQSELEELEQQILRVRRLIENRRELHKKQFCAIEAEAQRLKEILTFITG